MAVIVALALGGALATQPREIVDMLPFLLIPGVLAARRVIGLSTAAILAFLGFSLLLSRLWLPIGEIGTDLTKLQQFPRPGLLHGDGLLDPAVDVRGPAGGGRSRRRGDVAGRAQRAKAGGRGRLR